jgi:hypothetical protein
VRPTKSRPCHAATQSVPVVGAFAATIFVHVVPSLDCQSPSTGWAAMTTPANSVNVTQSFVVNVLTATAALSAR